MAGRVVPLGLEFFLFNRADGWGDRFICACFLLTVLVAGVDRFICACFLLTVLAAGVDRFICACFSFNRTGSGIVPLYLRLLLF